MFLKRRRLQAVIMIWLGLCMGSSVALASENAYEGRLVIINQTPGGYAFTGEDLSSFLPVIEALEDREAWRLAPQQQALVLEEVLKRHLPHVSEVLSARLPSQEPIGLSLAYLPVENALQGWGVVRERTLTDGTKVLFAPRTTPHLFQLIEGQIQKMEQSSKQQEEHPLFAKALAHLVNIWLFPDNQYYEIQFMGALANIGVTLGESTSEVDIWELRLPGLPTVSRNPIGLLSIVSSVRAQEQALLNVKFGRRQAVRSNGLDLAFAVEGKVGTPGLRDSIVCENRHVVTPFLRGTLKKGALDYPVLRELVNGLAVGFHVYELNLDLKAYRVSNLDVRISAGVDMGPDRWMMGCFAIASVQERLSAELNRLLEDLMGNLFF